MTDTTTVLLADDQALIRSGLRTLLEASGVRVVGEAEDGREAHAMAKELRPSVVLMDLRMPVLDGVLATQQIRADRALRDVRILVLTTFDGDPDVLMAIRAGADGFLSKSADAEDLMMALEAVAAGRPTLSEAALRAVMRNVSPPATKSAVDPELERRVGLLTQREREVVRRLARGTDLIELAGDLHISPHTAKTHVNRAMLKLGARDRGQLVAIAYQSSLCS